ncbi:MAG: hypothetical protein U1E81_14780 [Xanthobacteraceae bacterium]
MVKYSLRLLTHDDRMAIATYLMDVDANAPSKPRRSRCWGHLTQGPNLAGVVGDEFRDRRRPAAPATLSCLNGVGRDSAAIGERWRAQGDSNPCFRRERDTSLFLHVRARLLS